MAVLPYHRSIRRRLLPHMMASMLFFAYHTFIPCQGQEPTDAVAHWTADNTADDTAGFSHGQLSGGVSYGPGIRGSAFVFDGSSGEIILNHTTALELGANEDFTASVLIRPEVPLQDIYGLGTIFSFTYACSPEVNALMVSTGVIPSVAGDMYWALRDSNDIISELSSPKVNLFDGRWHHVVVIRDSRQKNQKMIIDGMLVATRTDITSGPISRTDAYDVQPDRIGAVKIPCGTKRYFRGSIDELQIFKRVLSQEEIASLMAINNPPIANAGANQTVFEGKWVELDGSLSFDPDDDPLSYHWEQVAGSPVDLSDSTTVKSWLLSPLQPAMGQEMIGFKLTVTDPAGAFSSSALSILVQDYNAPPDCSLAQAFPQTLWPPNHKLVPISIQNITDSEDSVAIEITRVTQDEPVARRHRGIIKRPDAYIIDPAKLLLRAERMLWQKHFRRRNGRVYHIDFTATDTRNAQCHGTVTVSVPIHKNQKSIDDGRLYDSQSGDSLGIAPTATTR